MAHNEMRRVRQVAQGQAPRRKTPPKEKDPAQKRPRTGAAHEFDVTVAIMTGPGKGGGPVNPKKGNVPPGEGS